jgi:hypothetical protein
MQLQSEGEHCRTGANWQIPLEAKGEALARTLQLAFEPETLPSPTFLREKVIPIIIPIFEQVCTYCEQQIQNRML